MRMGILWTVDIERSGRVKRFHRHYRGQWYYSTGTMEGSGTTQPALLGACPLYTEHGVGSTLYREKLPASQRAALVSSPQKPTHVLGGKLLY